MAPKGSSGFVYFVTNGDAIKIGFASDVAKRLTDLQVAHHAPLSLLGSIKALPREEKEIHQKLKHIRIMGEWFQVHDDVFSLMEEYEKSGRFIEGYSMEDYEERVMRSGYTAPNAEER